MGKMPRRCSLIGTSEEDMLQCCPVVFSGSIGEIFSGRNECRTKKEFHIGSNIKTKPD